LGRLRAISRAASAADRGSVAVKSSVSQIRSGSAPFAARAASQSEWPRL
jgi:hypothetical protein